MALWNARHVYDRSQSVPSVARNTCPRGVRWHNVAVQVLTSTATPFILLMEFRFSLRECFGRRGTFESDKRNK